MIDLEIVNIDGYLYHLKDDKGETCVMNLDFLDIDKKPEVGNHIHINSELLNPRYEGYSASYTFGSMESKYGRANLTLNDIDVIKVVVDDKEIYLKRLYG